MKSKTKFQKGKASKSAFYVILPLPSCKTVIKDSQLSKTFVFGYEVVLCYQKEIAEALSVGCGRPVTFFNFYLS